MKCKEHPRYKGKGEPAKCGACWAIYFSVGSMRKPTAKPSRPHSQRGYTRKVKHKKKSV